jgi:hypothetical protein
MDHKRFVHKYLPPSLGSVRYAHEKGQRHAPVRYAERANVMWTDLGRDCLYGVSAPAICTQRRELLDTISGVE